MKPLEWSKGQHKVEKIVIGHVNEHPTFWNSLTHIVNEFKILPDFEWVTAGNSSENCIVGMLLTALMTVYKQ